MRTLSELQGLMERGDGVALAVWLVSFALWSCAVWGLAKVMFRSWPADKLMEWHENAFGDAMRIVHQASWSIRFRREYNLEAVNKKRPDLARALTEDEIADAKRDRRAARIRAEAGRFIAYPFGCEFCQAAQAALMLLICCSTRAAMIPSMLAYGVVSAFVVGRLIPRAVAGESRK